jgi:hypothetical protein
MKARLILGVVVLGVLALGVAATASGVSQIRTRTTGERATADVSGCETTGTVKSRTIDCRGSWVTGGRLVGGGGHVVVGKVEGADYGDVGHRIDVRLSGDGQHAYTPSLATPILYVALGLVFLALGLFLGAGVLRRRAKPAPAASPSGLPTAG